MVDGVVVRKVYRVGVISPMRSAVEIHPKRKAKLSNWAAAAIMGITLTIDDLPFSHLLILRNLLSIGENSMHGIRRIVAWLALLGVLLSACAAPVTTPATGGAGESSAAAGEPKAGGTLTVGWW